MLNVQCLKDLKSSLCSCNLVQCTFGEYIWAVSMSANMLLFAILVSCWSQISSNRFGSRCFRASEVQRWRVTGFTTRQHFPDGSYHQVQVISFHMMHFSNFKKKVKLGCKVVFVFIYCEFLPAPAYFPCCHFWGLSHFCFLNIVR